jgi:methylglutaconyl-CoA hydratase
MQRGNGLETLLNSISDRGIATLAFNRPDRANSYDAPMLDALADGFERFGSNNAVRVIVLRGNGKHFSAGAAIGEGGQPRRAIGEVCGLIDAVPKPTVAVVQGACIGGALALASCCDVIVASRAASFSIPEVRLGLAPGPLIGFFARAMGHRALRRYLLSGERFSAEEAHRIGLVQELCDAQAIESAADELIDRLLFGAPGAVAAAKHVLQKQAPAVLLSDELRDLQAAFDAMAVSDEAAEGRAAFKEKRKPTWYPQS